MAERAFNSSATSLKDFKQVKLLGEGAFAAVFKVVRYADGETYALKKVKLPSLSDKEKQNALNEIRLLASVQQENIVSYKDAFFDDRTRCLCIVTECCDSGDLMDQITRCQKDRSHIAETDIWRWMIGLSHALKALHAMKIFHRDMKSANVFLHSAPNGRVAKLGDFNVSTVAKKGLCVTQTGTPYYASPEIWRDMPYDGKSDMWGLGAVIYEAAALNPPFQAEDMEGLADKVCRGKYKRIPKVFSDSLSDAISLLLQVNPRHRPSPEQVLLLPIVQKRALHLNLAEEVPCESNLLSTIKLPRKLVDLSLPLPKYGQQQHPQNDCDMLSPCGNLNEHRIVGSSHPDDVPQSNIIHQGIGSNCPSEPESNGLDVQQRHAAREIRQLKARKKKTSLEPYAKRGRVQPSERHRRADGRTRSQAPVRRRPDEGKLPEIEFSKTPVDQGAGAQACYMPEPQDPAKNLLPRILLAPSKALPEGLRLKLPRIASCPGQLV
jgi:serine/threonine protein kinase